MGLEVRLPQSRKIMLSKILLTVLHKRKNFDKSKEYTKTHVIKNENVLQQKFCMRFIVLQLVILDTGVS